MIKERRKIRIPKPIGSLFIALHLAVAYWLWYHYIFNVGTQNLVLKDIIVIIAIGLSLAVNIWYLGFFQDVED